MAKQLVVLAGPDEGRIFHLGSDALFLGRSRATESHLLDPHVSRIHCQVLQEGDRWVVADYDSAAGTFVNGKRVSKQALVPGDIIRIGNTRLQFAEDAGAQAAAAPAGAPVAAPGAKRASLPVAQPIAGQGAPPRRKGAVPVAQPAGARGPAWAASLVGQKIAHFKIGSPLARSNSGYVFHAREIRKNIPVALKVLDPEFSSNQKSVKRFVEAMKSVMPLRHPYLIKFYGAGKTSGHCWIAMEYVAGESLAAVVGRIEQTGMLDWRQVMRLGIRLARALEYAHGKKLIHQSVTPQNILVGKDQGQVKLTDLMLATAIDGDPTKPISAAGVPSEELSYMPPERTDGPGKTVDSRADVYSLGATLYAMLTGQPPFQASTVADLVAKIRLEAPPSLKTLHLGIPDDFERLVVRCLAKRPEDRFPNMKEVLRTMAGLAKAHKLTT
ncbi:MAG: protein kinase [Planctomycetes bacterium]|nr:protein kinase [Planctomycetota bacterium]